MSIILDWGIPSGPHFLLGEFCHNYSEHFFKQEMALDFSLLPISSESDADMKWKTALFQIQKRVHLLKAMPEAEK